MIKLPPLPEPDGWAGKDWYHRPATTLADISKFELEQARYTADQMHAYSDAENAALHTQVRVLRDALVMCSTAGDGLTLAQEAQIRAALKASK